MPIPFSTKTQFEDWVSLHETLGCYGCMYATKKKLGNNPCCTFPGPIDTLEVDKDWRCINRKEEEGDHEPDHPELMYNEDFDMQHGLVGWDDE